MVNSKNISGKKVVIKANNSLRRQLLLMIVVLILIMLMQLALLPLEAPAPNISNFVLSRPIFEKKEVGSRVMALYRGTWHWAKIYSIEETTFVVKLEDKRNTQLKLETNQLITEREASLWLNNLYFNITMQLRKDSALPNREDIGFYPLFPFSWISGAPRPLYTHRIIGSRVLARSFEDKKWHWGKILNVLDQNLFTVDFENGDISYGVDDSDVKTEVQASAWLMDLYFEYNNKSEESFFHTKENIVWKSKDIDIEMLWVGDASKYPKVSIVISMCNNNLKWLSDFIAGYKIHNITVISKCGLSWEEGVILKRLKIIHLPNVGRCDHSYAYWMARMYERSIENNEIIFFLKDNIGVRRPAHSRSLDTMIRIIDDTGFACFEEPNDGLSTLHETSALATFAFGNGNVGPEEYKRLERDKGELFKNENYKNLGEYAKSLNISLPMPLIPVCYGGNFAVRSSQIKKRSQQFWNNLEHVLSRGDNIEEGHFQERLWAGILSNQLNSEASQVLLSKSELVDPAQFSGAFVGTLIRPVESHGLVHAVATSKKNILKRDVNLPVIGGLKEEVGDWEFFNSKIHHLPSIRKQVKQGRLKPIDFEQLWVSGVSTYRKISLVISFCHNNLIWLDKFVNNYKIHQITIISKCGYSWKKGTLPKGALFVHLPNVGGCDHSYAYWMANMHQQHSAVMERDEDEVVFFLKDNIDIDRLAYARSFDSMIQIVDEIGFSCFEKPKEGSSIFQETSSLYNFTLPNYNRLESYTKGSSKNPIYKNLGDFVSTLGFTLPKPLTPVCYGGNFAVRSSQISRRTKVFWQNLERSLNWTDNIGLGHFQERVWAGILAEQIELNVSQLLLDISHTKRATYNEN